MAKPSKPAAEKKSTPAPEPAPTPAPEPDAPQADAEEDTPAEPTREALEAAAADMVDTMLLTETALNADLSELDDEELKDAITTSAEDLVGTENLKEKQKGDPQIEGIDLLNEATIKVLDFLGCNPGVGVRPPPEEKPAKTAKAPKTAKEKKPPKEKKEKVVKEKSRYGHQIGAMSAKIDEMVFEGVTLADAAKKIQEAAPDKNYSEDAAKARFLSHVKHLEKDLSVKVPLNEKTGVFKAEKATL